MLGLQRRDLDHLGRLVRRPRRGGSGGGGGGAGSAPIVGPGRRERLSGALGDCRLLQGFIGSQKRRPTLAHLQSIIHTVVEREEIDTGMTSVWWRVVDNYVKSSHRRFGSISCSLASPRWGESADRTASAYRGGVSLPPGLCPSDDRC